MGVVEGFDLSALEEDEVYEKDEEGAEGEERGEGRMAEFFGLLLLEEEEEEEEEEEGSEEKEEREKELIVSFGFSLEPEAAVTETD
jgi:hypothetical protein